MIANPLLLKIGVGALIVFVLLGAGYKVGYDRAENKVGREARILVLEARGERDACTNEIAKLNAANAANASQQVAELKADKDRTDRARRALEAAVKDLAQLQRENMAIAQEAKEYLKDASDACAAAPMPDDLNVLLDRLANPSRYGSGAVPRDADGDRPGVPQPDAAVSGQ